MRRLLNTLYITSDDIYLSLENENVVAWRAEKKAGMFPLHTIQAIEYFGHKGVSPALMEECASRDIALNLYRPSGRFRARICGLSSGNSLVKREQYRVADDALRSAAVARGFILGKVINAKRMLERARRDHALRVDCVLLTEGVEEMSGYVAKLGDSCELERLRGIEGTAARCYFKCFDELILGDRDTFRFTGRNRRPPTDPMNALLSFAYVLLANDCASALEGAGLDPYAGFLHCERPGRKALALDLMEELRSPIADRVVLTSINNRILGPGHFAHSSDGSMLLNEEGRRIFLDCWQRKKKEEVIHPYLGEKVPWGLMPHVQAKLLARHLRGDIDGYPPFLWK